MKAQLIVIGVLVTMLIYFAAVSSGLAFDNVRMRMEISKLKTRCEMLEPSGH